MFCWCLVALQWQAWFACSGGTFVQYACSSCLAAVPQLLVGCYWFLTLLLMKPVDGGCWMLVGFGRVVQARLPCWGSIGPGVLTDARVAATSTEPCERCWECSGVYGSVLLSVLGCQQREEQSIVLVSLYLGHTCACCCDICVLLCAASSLCMVCFCTLQQQWQQQRSLV